MNQVWFSGSARLPIVMLEGVVVGLLDDAEIVLRTALLHALHQVAKLGQREGRRSNLLAQARHDGLYPPGKRAPQKAVGTLIRLYLRNLTAFHSAASFVARYSGNDWSNLPERRALRSFKRSKPAFPVRKLGRFTKSKRCSGPITSATFETVGNL